MVRNGMFIRHGKKTYIYATGDLYIMCKNGKDLVNLQRCTWIKKCEPNEVEAAILEHNSKN